MPILFEKYARSEGYQWCVCVGDQRNCRGSNLDLDPTSSEPLPKQEKKVTALNYDKIHIAYYIDNCHSFTIIFDINIHIEMHNVVLTGDVNHTENAN